MDRFQKLLLIFSVATHCYGQQTLRRATTLRAASKSAKSTVILAQRGLSVSAPA